jgi:[ribosomal protein S18]-alanine N-acetyltransferase
VSRRIAPVPPGAALLLSIMHAAAFPDEPWDAAAFDRILALSGVFGLLVWHADAPVGFVLARDLGDETEILSLAVLPAARRQGVARALLDAVVAHAAAQRSASIVLEVAADNDAARNLYSGCGFVPVGRRPRYYRRPGGTADGLILRRPIAGEIPPRE